MSSPRDSDATGEIRWLFLEEDDGDEKTEAGVGDHVKTMLGYTLAFLSVLFLAAGAVCAQELGGLVPPFELNTWRFLAQGLLAVPSMTITPQRRLAGWLTLVCVLAVVYNVFYYTAATYLPVGTLGGLTTSAMVFAAALIALIIYREYSWHVTVSVVVCVVGIVLVTQPEFIFGGETATVYHPMCGNPPPSNNQTPSANSRSTINPDLLSTGEHIIGYCMAVAAGCCGTVIFFVINKKLQDMNSFVQSLWMGAVGTVVSLILMLIFENVTMPETLTCGLLLCGHALGAGGGTTFFVMSINFISPVVLSLVMTFQVVLLFICQYTVMKPVAPGRHNDAEIVGAVIVFMGNVISPLYKFYAAKTGKTQN